MIQKFVIPILIPLLLAASAVVVILFARGYRFNTEDTTLESTGVLVATSEPDAAQIYINGAFSGATDSNINLSPDWYEIKISKEGYHDWIRNLRIQGEIVVKTNAVLFLKNPSLSALTTTGVTDPIMSPDGTQIAYIASPSATLEDTGESVFESVLDVPTLFIYELNGSGLPFSRNPRPYEGTREQLIAEWELEKQTLHGVALRGMPDEFVEIATDSMKIYSFSPDDSKVLYEATASASLARVIEPPLLGTFPTEQVRELTPGSVYVYDKKEDTNYALDVIIEEDEDNPFAPLPIQWLSTSRHFILTREDRLEIAEYDGENIITVYSGPFEKPSVFPHPRGHQIIILTSLNAASNDLPSLYTLNIR